MPTPFASHAFHPIDGFSQSFPYHLYPILFPLNKYASVALFVFVNFWTIMIHDGEYVADSPVINGAACHTMHHLYFNYNYGQYTTLWDRLGGSYRKPDPDLFDKEKKMSDAQWKQQAKGVEEMTKKVEGVDDRVPWSQELRYDGVSLRLGETFFMRRNTSKKRVECVTTTSRAGWDDLKRFLILIP
ncbi:hypothetical protein CIB48_g7330 [Xylaria polymorpha]|nr:hypothetical protein CIB48_g7330 [Xylaria polymorpha]